MKLWILSDLHIEQSFWDLPEPRPEYDVLVAAGDIHKAQEGVRWLAERVDRPVIYVPGNHEAYGRTLPDELEAAQALASDLGVHLLTDEAVVIGNVRFLGATLWTDYELMAPSPVTVEEAMKEASRFLNDHRQIRMSGGLFTPTNALTAHKASRAWLTQELAVSPAGIRKTVVVTHHLPDPRSISPQYDGDKLNPAFASNLTDLVENGGADLWVQAFDDAQALLLCRFGEITLAQLSADFHARLTELGGAITPETSHAE